jgi:hypothetical protein
VQDRVADELAGTVVRDVAAPIGVDELGSDRRRIDEHVGEIGARPHREDVGVLQQQQPVVGPVGEQPVLQRVGIPVGHRAQPSHPEHRRRRRREGL